MNNLLKLDIRENNLSALPDTVGELTNLNYLDISKNRLSSVPEEIKDLSKLRFLNLKENTQLGKKAMIYRDMEIKELFNS